jgi:hypothetical protein
MWFTRKRITSTKERSRKWQNSHANAGDNVQSAPVKVVYVLRLRLVCDNSLHSPPHEAPTLWSAYHNAFSDPLFGRLASPSDLGRST